MSVMDDLVCDPILSRNGGNCNIGRVLSPHDVRLMKTVNLRKKEGINLLREQSDVDEKLGPANCAQDEPSHQVEVGDVALSLQL